MKIMITDDIRCCPRKIPYGYSLVQVTKKNIAQYSNNTDVEIAICSRGLAKFLLQYEFPGLKLVQLFSVGYDNLDLSLFKDRGVAVCNASGIYDDVLAEYVLFAMLSIAKRFHSNVNNRCFRPLRNYHYISEISGKTIGIMGCGKIGSCVAHHLSGFNVCILGYARNTDNKDGFRRIYHKSEIGDFVSQCDYIINTMPDNNETRGLINNEFLSHCKENVSIINIGRDSIFYNDDFYEFLRSHKKSTAVLDQFELIPNPLFNKYHRLTNVIITPRIAAVSGESDLALKDLIERNIDAFAGNGQLTNRLV